MKNNSGITIITLIITIIVIVMIASITIYSGLDTVDSLRTKEAKDTTNAIYLAIIANENTLPSGSGDGKMLSDFDIISNRTLSDKDFAQAYQHIVRNYLETRFDFPFTKAATSEFSKGFFQVTKNLLSEDKENAFANIAASFVRSDYIRYSKNATFKTDERENLIETAITNIETLERIEKEDKDSKGESNA